MCRRKKSLPLPVLSALLFAAGLARADYPLVSQRYAADPTGIEFNGRLYLYCSNDDDNSTNSYAMHSFVCFSTDDLKNWTDHGVVFDVPANAAFATLAWAPSVVSNYGKLYLYFGNGAANIGVATSSVPVGPFIDARGNALVTGSTPGASTPTQWLFDPCAFVDSDGQPYLYFGGQYPTNARVILLNTNMTSVSGSATPVFATNFFEASCLHTRGSTYYFTYSTRPEAGMVIYCETNSNPTNGFAPEGTVLPNPPTNVYNNNHHSIFSYQGNWYIAYHNRAVAKQNGLSDADAVYKRSVCLDRVEYSADGSIQQVIPTTDGLPQLKNLNPYNRVEGETIAQQSGIKTEVCAEGGLDVTSITNGCWTRVRGADFGAGAAAFYARVASVSTGGNIELHLDGLGGPRIGTCAVAPTGGRQTWTTAVCTVGGASGVHDLYLKFTGGAANLFNLNWWQFQANPGSGSVLAHRYSFSEAGGTTVADSVGGPAWTGTLPNGGTFSGGQLILASNLQQYVKLPAGIVSNMTAVTIEAWATFAANLPWPSWFFGFGNISGTVGANYLFCSEGGGRFAVAGMSPGYLGETNVYTPGLSWSGRTLHIACAFNPPGGYLAIFTNGVLAGTNASGTYTMTSVVNNFSYLNRSLYSSDPYVNLTLNEFRIWNGARSAGEIADSYANGPDQLTKTATVDSTTTYQVIEGLGGAMAFYAGWLTAHPYKQEIYTNAFAGLNLSMLRLGNWFRYTNSPDYAGYEIVSNANRVLGQPVPVLISSWAPPAFLKSNGQVGNGGTLIYSNGGFAYSAFANYWYDSLLAYGSNGVSPTWISIQNEPDWAAGYDSCVFHPTEDTVNGTNYASYSKALDAVSQRLAALPAPPRILAPECVGLGYNDVQNYAATMNANSFYGVAHHLYGGSTDGTPDGYKGSMSALTNVFPGKPRFMTEYGITGVTNLSPMIEAAWLLHNGLTVEQASGYNFWSLVWPAGGLGLVQIENPFDGSRASWTNAPPGTTTQSHGWWLSPCYWAMKHFSCFIRPGYKRVAAACNDASVLTSAYLSTDGLRLVVVFINTSANTSSTVEANFGSFPYFTSSVYQTAGGNYFQALGTVGSDLTLPASSLTTVVLDKYVAVGAAANPSPSNNAAGVALGATLSWMPGNNAVSHALYLGLNSNAVAQGTLASPEFQGLLSSSFFTPRALAGSATYFWRVDEIAGVNTNTGPVWSFSTVPAPALGHRYSFSETTGSTIADSVGGPVWNGTLPNSGTLSTGQLTLASGSQQYVSLPAGVVSTLSNFTIEAWVKLNSTASWNRIFDFGNNTTTNMFLTPQNGSTTRVRFAITTSGAGGEQQIDGLSALGAGAWYHVAVTLNGANGVLYVNGAAVGTNSSMTLKPASLGMTSNNYLGRSQYSPDPYLNGVLDEFRIYSVALSASEIAATDALGPNQVLTTGSPSISLAAAGANLTMTWPLGSAGFTLQSRTNLILGHWVNLTTPVPQIVGGQWQVAVPVPGSTDSTFYRLAR